MVGVVLVAPASFLHRSGQMQRRAEAQCEWSDTWLAAGPFKHFVFQSASNSLQHPLPWSGNTAHFPVQPCLSALWFYYGCVSHSFTQVFSVPPHEWNHFSIAKTAACTCLLWTKFLGNYSDQWLRFLLLLFRSHFFLHPLSFFSVLAVNHVW